MNTDFHPLVSIVIPVYNGSNYLREAIDSALAQTYDNIEVIVVNDGSNDNGATEEICLSYGDKIRYFKKENGGVATALNLGIEKMQGEYFSWLSHDDIFIDNKISIQVNEAQKNGGKFIFGAYELIDCNGNKINDIFPSHIFQTHNPRLYLYRGLIHGCTTLIHRSIFIDFGLFDDSKKTTQDYDYWNKIFKKINPIYCDLILCKSREHIERGTYKEKSHKFDENKLWIKMIQELTLKDCLSMVSSPYAFYRTTAQFLSNTYMTEAMNVAEDIANKYKPLINEQVENIKVSIVIPFYNRINLLKACIYSALQQTHKNTEIILINDGSTDNISEIENIAQQNNKIAIFHQRNLGASAARNRGIAESSGEYIMFLDSDDELIPDAITKLLFAICKDGALAGHSSYYRYDLINHKRELIHSGQFSGNVYPRIISNCPISTSALIVRKDIISPNLFPEDIQLAEDIIAKIKISYKTPILGIDEPLLKVNASINYSKKEYAILGFSNLINFILKNPIFSKNDKEIKKIIQYMLAYYENSKEGTQFPIISRLSFYYKNNGLRKTIIKSVKYLYKNNIVNFYLSKKLKKLPYIHI